MSGFTKKIIYILSAVLIVFMFAACSEKFNLKTPVGTFNMTVDIADKYGVTAPAEGNQFLVVHLTPVSSDITVKKMQEYFRPDDSNEGAIAECGAGEYTFSSMHFEKSEEGNVCVIIFEIPEELTDSDKITLKLPK